MKKPLLFTFLLFTIISQASAQSYEGTWKGVMMQDSPIVRINFEMVLEQKEGKINGFLYRLFIVNDSLIYNTVRVTARVSGGILIVEDDASVSRNFEEKANRKIKAAYFFKLNPKQPDADTLKGEWTTSRFKNKYMSVSGSVIINREPRYETTQLFKRLEEKQLHTSIAFIPRKTAESTALNKPKAEPVAEITETNTPPSTIAITNTAIKTDSSKNTIALKEPEKQKIETKTSSQPSTLPSNPQPKNNTTPAPTPEIVKSEVLPKKDSVQTSVAVNKPPANTTSPKTNNQPVTNGAVNNNPLVKKETAPPTTAAKPTNTSTNQPKPVVTNPPVTNNTVAKNNTQIPATNKPAPTNTVTPPPQEKPASVLIKTDEAKVIEIPVTKQQQVTAIAPPVINNPIITKRATEVIQTLSVFEDSVVLSLYDNGEIDGDTVSVFLNNEKILSNVGLKASAFKHTIYFKPGETVQLTLFAENLGSIPPNSGLLVVYSGEQRYQVFFTSTLNKSAVIIMKRE
jgi:hypothetical protein